MITPRLSWPHPDTATALAVQALQTALPTLHPVLAQLLVQRGLESYEQVESFFAPGWQQLHDPFAMLGMEQAVTRIITAQSGQERILVYGDYDVDGTTSVALLSYFFQHANIPHLRYLPDRDKEGYGLSTQGIDYAKQEGVSLLIALDCGIKAVEKVAYANSLGLDVIICDHHLPGSTLPPALAILNPKQESCPYPYKHLSGCGIAFKLLQALCQRIQGCTFEPSRLLDLVALSIACDLVPITGENRTLTYLGLSKLRQQPLPGIAQLMALTDKPRRWNVQDLVFFLGPRINAAGRLQHAKAAVALLLGETTPEGSSSAALLEDTNTERKAVERALYQEALAIVAQDEAFDSRKALVLHQEHWHKGVIGIVASKLVERFYKPTVLLTRSNGYWVGSSRSVQDFDLYAALFTCQQHLLQFGGHQYAAGLTLTDEALPHFITSFEQACADRLQPHQHQPTLAIDAELNLSDITPVLLAQQARMEPFGPGNMQPVLYAQPVEVSTITILQGGHLRLTLRQATCTLPAIGFGLGTLWGYLKPGDCLGVAFTVGYNYYQGNRSIQLNVKALQLLN